MAIVEQRATIAADASKLSVPPSAQYEKKAIRLFFYTLVRGLELDPMVIFLF